MIYFVWTKQDRSNTGGIVLLPKIENKPSPLHAIYDHRLCVCWERGSRVTVTHNTTHHDRREGGRTTCWTAEAVGGPTTRNHQNLANFKFQILTFNFLETNFPFLDDITEVFRWLQQRSVSGSSGLSDMEHGSQRTRGVHVVIILLYHMITC